MLVFECAISVVVMLVCASFGCAISVVILVCASCECAISVVSMLLCSVFNFDSFSKH